MYVKPASCYFSIVQHGVSLNFEIFHQPVSCELSSTIFKRLGKVTLIYKNAYTTSAVSIEVLAGTVGRSLRSTRFASSPYTPLKSPSPATHFNGARSCFAARIATLWNRITQNRSRYPEGSLQPCPISRTYRHSSNNLAH